MNKCSPKAIRHIMILIHMITLAGASAMPVLRPQYLILVIFDDFRARFESTSRYRTKMVRIVSKCRQKLARDRGDQS